MIVGCCPELDRVDELLGLVTAQPYVMECLATVAISGLPVGWLGAGVLRDLVWGELHDGFDPSRVNDIDVGFFDPTELARERDFAATRHLTSLLDRPWEAINQAAVHTWYHDWFEGPPVTPLRTVHDGVATAPETAVCVALRLVDGGIEVCAPFGLDDLLDGVWRHNPARFTAGHSANRLRTRRVAERWPKIRIAAAAAPEVVVAP